MSSADDPDPLVSVRRHPNDWQTAQVRLSRLRGFRLDRISGGVNRATAHPTVFAYMVCDAIESGELGHSCAHGPGPHDIKVAVPKVCNDKALWKAIRDLVNMPATAECKVLGDTDGGKRSAKSAAIHARTAKCKDGQE